MTDFGEKRGFLRMPIDCELSFLVEGSPNQYQGNVINLSGKGILFTSNEKFESGTALKIIITPSNSTTPPMEADVVVTRVSGNEELYEVACEIREAKD